MSEDVQILASSTIDDQATLAFAQLSGDHNPLHVDPVTARRYQYGHTVIHGVFGTLTALNFAYEKLQLTSVLKELSVNYNRPIRQGDEFSIACTQIENGAYRLNVLCGGRKAQVIKFSITGDRPEHAVQPAYREANPQPRELALPEAAGLTEQIRLSWDERLCQRLLPRLHEHLDHGQLAFMLGLTNVVGMRCPGTHSVFAGLKVDFQQAGDIPRETMRYRVTSADSRFSRALLTVDNCMGSGQIEAMFRAPMIRQAAMKDVLPLLSGKPFAGQTALVVGGSRGLGETTAKLISAGGGRVIISYARGRADAEKIARDIKAEGGDCRVIALNVLDLHEDARQILLSESINHVYYFASPLIERNDDLFDVQLFRKFCDYYVAGFTSLANIFAADKARRSSPLTLFVPSTVFIDQAKKGFAEYISAKAAAESCAHQLAAKFRKWRVVLPRLQPMLTDQTAAVLDTQPEDNLSIMLEILTDMLQQQAGAET